MTILEQIKAKHDSSGGHCGCYLTDFKGNHEEIKKEMNRLYKENKITTHDGVHGKLIKYNDQN